jgi:hypothetical protein
MLYQFMPFLRLDGYYLVSDITGVPDLFARIKPVLGSMIPGSRTDRQVQELKPWARRVVGVVAGLLQIVLLVVPVAGVTLIFALVGKGLSGALWRWSEGKPLRRICLASAALAFVGGFAGAALADHGLLAPPRSLTATVSSAASAIVESLPKTPEEKRRLLGLGVILLTLAVAALMAWKLPMRRTTRTRYLYLASGTFLVLLLAAVALALTIPGDGRPAVSQVRGPLISQAPPEPSSARGEEDQRAHQPRRESDERGATEEGDVPRRQRPAGSPDEVAAQTVQSSVSLPAQDPVGATATPTASPATETAAATAEPDAASPPPTTELDATRTPPTPEPPAQSSVTGFRAEAPALRGGGAPVVSQYSP